MQIDLKSHAVVCELSASSTFNMPCPNRSLPPSPWSPVVPARACIARTGSVSHSHRSVSDSKQVQAPSSLLSSWYASMRSALKHHKPSTLSLSVGRVAQCWCIFSRSGYIYAIGFVNLTGAASFKNPLSCEHGVPLLTRSIAVQVLDCNELFQVQSG